MNLFDLPTEILDQIWAYLDTTFEHCYWDSPDNTTVIRSKIFQCLCLVSRTAHQVALPLRYREVNIESSSWLHRFNEYIRRHPSRAELIRTIVLGRQYWKEVDSLSLNSNWKYLVNLRELRILDHLRKTNIEELSPTGDDFPNLRTCRLNLQGRHSRCSTSEAQIHVSDLVPFWSAPRLQKFEIQNGHLVDYWPVKGNEYNSAVQRPNLASLSLVGITFNNCSSLQELFAIRKTHRLAMRSVCMKDGQYDTISTLLSADLKELELSTSADCGVSYGQSNFQHLHELRSLKVEISHLLHSHASFTPVSRLCMHVTPSLPENLRWIQVTIRTDWRPRAEAYCAITFLINAWSGKNIEFNVRLLQPGDLRCFGNGATENFHDGITASEANWRFTIGQMHELQQISERASIKFTAESAWFREADDGLSYL